MSKINSNIQIEDAKICFRNFSGKEGRFNKAGDRNFCVLISDEIAEQLRDDGWNIRYLQPRDEGEESQAYLQVAVKFGDIPPRIVMITSRGKTILDEESVALLDWAEIETVDIIIRPYNWEVNGKSGVKAYVKAMYVTLIEDDFEKKYVDVPDSAANSFQEEPV